MSEFVNVTTQKQLEKAVKNGDIPVCRDGFFVASGSATVEAFGSATVEAFDSATVRAFDSATVRAFGSATVRASGSATVEASDSATVEASDSATVEAFGSATVRAFGSATVEAFGSATVRAFGSATVRAFGSATVRASGSATVEASDSATVRAFGSATVEASGSATVEAFGSATVRASGSATVEASDSSSVNATPFVAVQRHGKTAKVKGGVLIQIPEVKTAEQFCEYYGLKAARGIVTLYKVVSAEFVSAHGANYAPGEKPAAPDWKPEPYCGNGLHFSPRPYLALRYADGPKFVACPVRLDELVVITQGYGQPDKVKAPRVVGRGCYEVDQDGERVAAAK